MDKVLVLSHTCQQSLQLLKHYIFNNDERVLGKEGFMLTTDRASYFFEDTSFLYRNLDKISFDKLLVDKDLDIEQSVLNKLSENIEKI